MSSMSAFFSSIVSSVDTGKAEEAAGAAGQDQEPDQQLRAVPRQEGVPAHHIGGDPGIASQQNLRICLFSWAQNLYQFVESTWQLLSEASCLNKVQRTFWMVILLIKLLFSPSGCALLWLWPFGVLAFWGCGLLGQFTMLGAFWGSGLLSCGLLGLWPFEVVAFWGISLCWWPFGLWPFGAVAFWGCGLLRLWPFGSVAFWVVAFWGCGLLGCGLLSCGLLG